MIGGMLLTPWVVAALLAPGALVLRAAAVRGPDRILVPRFVAGFAATLVASPALMRRVVRRLVRDDRDGPPRDAR